MLAQYKDIETTDNCFEVTLKYYNTFATLIEQIIQYYNSKESKVTPHSIILYEIMYHKTSQSFTIINKYDNESKNIILEKLKICHQGRFVVVIKGQEGSLVNSI
jgi:hypothetical protein